MNLEKGIIDRERNPFAISDWIRQNLSFTPYRQESFKLLIGMKERAIREIGRDYGRYPAFLAIRWGFACMLNDKLTPTEKWNYIEKYDQKGNLKPLIK